MQLRATSFSLALAVLSAPVAAQTTPDKDINRVENRLERKRDRVVDKVEMTISKSDEQVEKPAQPFTLSFGSPIAYSSNIGNDETGALGSTYADPSLSLTGEWSLGPAVLTVEGGVDAQIFSSHSAYDNATAYGTVNLTLPGVVSPYADYTVASIYDGIFADHSVTLHMFTLGASSEIALGDSDLLVIDANAMRRESAIPEVEQWRYGLSGQWVHILENGSTFALSARGRYADYTCGTAATRTDKNLRLAATYKLPLDEGLSLKIGASFERNWSNRANKSYSVWDLGPTVTFSRKF